MSTDNQNRSSIAYLDSQLESVYFNQGYSKQTVKNFVAELLKELEFQKDSFELQTKDLFNDKNRLEEENKALEEKLKKALELDPDTNQKEVEELTGKVDELQKNLEEANKRCKSYESLLTKAKEKMNQDGQGDDQQIEKYRLENEALQKELEEYKKQMGGSEKLLEDVEKLQKENHKLSKDLKEVNELKEKMVQELEEAKNEASHSRSAEAYEHLQKTNKLLETEIFSLSKSIEELTDKTVKQNKQLNDMTSEMDQIREENNQAINARTEMHLRLSSYAELFNEMKDELEYNKSNIDVLKRQLEDQREKNRFLSGLKVEKVSEDLKG